VTAINHAELALIILEYSASDYSERKSATFDLVERADLILFSASQIARSFSPSATAVPATDISPSPDLRGKVQAIRDLAGAVIEQGFAVDLGYDQTLDFRLAG